MLGAEFCGGSLRTRLVKIKNGDCCAVLSKEFRSCETNAAGTGGPGNDSDFVFEKHGVFLLFVCCYRVCRSGWLPTSEKFAPIGELGSSFTDGPLFAAFGAPRL